MNDHFSGSAGPVDADGFGPVYLERRDTGQDIARAWAGQRDRVFEISKIEILDREMLPLLDDAMELFLTVFLLEYTGDYYRGKVDHVVFIWSHGDPTTVDYPAKA